MTYKGWLECRRDTLEQMQRGDKETNSLRMVKDALAFLGAEQDRRRRKDRVQRILSAELNAHMITAALYNRIMAEL